jgi:beta-mannosidase
MQIEAGLGERLGAELAVTNDTLSSVSGEVVWQICDGDSRVLRCGREQLTVDAMSAKWLDGIDVGDIDPKNHHMHFALLVGGKVKSEGFALFTAPKSYNFATPELEYKIEGNELVIISRAYAKNVEISSPDGDILLEDNFFDMEAGEKRIRILSGCSNNISLRSFCGADR